MSKKQTKKQGRAAAMPLSQIIKKLIKRMRLRVAGGLKIKPQASSGKLQA
jgi:hypothetical protein